MRETVTGYRHGISRGLVTIALLVAFMLGLGDVGGARAQESDYAIGASVAVASETLTYRAAPSVDAAALLVLMQGERGTITAGPVIADGYTWYELSTVDYSGTPGWVAGEFLTPGGDGAPAGSTLVVELDGLNLRTAPGLNGPIIAALPAGMRLALLSGPVDVDDLSWYEVESLDKTLTGWVVGKYLTAPAPAAALLPGDTVIVTIADLNFRERPGVNAPIRSTLPLGTVAEIIGGPLSADGLVWYQLALAGVQGNGWVAVTYIAKQ
jgi:uncharacterized protein YraI